MLRRGKPLAHFVDDYPAEPNEDIIPEGAFEPYVRSGTFVKRDWVERARATQAGVLRSTGGKARAD